MGKSRKRRRYHPQRHSRQMSQSLHRSSEIVIEGWNTETKLSSFHGFKLLFFPSNQSTILSGICFYFLFLCIYRRLKISEQDLKILLLHRTDIYTYMQIKPLLNLEFINRK